MSIVDRDLLGKEIIINKFFSAVYDEVGLCRITSIRGLLDAML